jgi:neutral ceramidase
MRFLVPCLALALLTACPTEEVVVPPDTGPDWPALTEGTLRAGAIDGTLDLPVGVPLGGFTGRDRALGSEPGPDTRDSDYRTDFVPSGGWQTRIPLQTLWMENGTETAVLVRIDVIYSFDGLTEAIGARLTEETGIDLTDSVFTFTNHSHSSYGTFSKATLLFFGADFWREEIMNRMVEQIVDQALAAQADLTEAAIGLGIDPLFDPIGDDSIFRDRREENSELLRPDGEVSGPGWKDERATMLRIDSTDGEPIAALLAFGIHGTIMGGSNSMLTSEAGGHITDLLNHRHGGPVWFFAQGAGGDASPAGRFGGFAQMEWVANHAADRILSLYDATELSSDPIQLEPVTRYVEQGRQIRVTRNGTVDLHYMDWDPLWDEQPYIPDMRIWNNPDCNIQWTPECEVLSPLDEFWTEFGAALCGEPDIDISIFGLNVPLPQYASCLDVDLGYSLFRIGFRRYIESRDDYPLPLPESRTALLGALGLRQIPITTVGEGTRTDDLVIAFAPGEPTTLWTQFLRHRAREEQGVPETFMIGYAMDHEGYLLTVEDWLHAGYESTITWWGPLQGEHLMERLLEVAGIANTPLKEDASWPDYPTETWYPDWDTPFVEPDATPDAGTTADPLPTYVWTVDGSQPATAEPSDVTRIQGIARWTFYGSDPATGLVRVEVEQETTPGTWEALTTPTGTPVSDALPDVLVTYTPRPLSGTGEDPDPLRDHIYHVEWQAVDTWDGLDSMPGLPLGTYRLHAYGASRDPADNDYPYDTTPWEATTASFDVLPADVLVSGTPAGDSLIAAVSYAPQPRGYRLLHMISSPRDATPLVVGADGVSCEAENTAGEVTALDCELVSETEVASTVEMDLGGLGAGSWAVRVDDGWGNVGTLDLTL